MKFCIGLWLKDASESLVCVGMFAVTVQSILRKVFHILLEPDCRDLSPFSYEMISEVNH